MGQAWVAMDRDLGRLRGGVVDGPAATRPPLLAVPLTSKCRPPCSPCCHRAVQSTASALSTLLGRPSLLL